MCKRYVYSELCGDPSCDVVASRKHRNVYCREGLDARRLGRCSAGITTVALRLPRRRSPARCSVCKAPSRSRSRETSGSVSAWSASAIMVANKKSPTRKARSYCLFEHVFKDALEAEERKEQHGEDDLSADTGDLFCVVEEDAVVPIETGEGSPGHRRESKLRKRAQAEAKEDQRSTGSLPQKRPTMNLVDPYGLQQLYQVREVSSV